MYTIYLKKKAVAISIPWRQNFSGTEGDSLST